MLSKSLPFDKKGTTTLCIKSLWSLNEFGDLCFVLFCFKEMHFLIWLQKCCHYFTSITQKFTKDCHQPFSATVQASSSDSADVTWNKIHAILGNNNTRELSKGVKHASRYYRCYWSSDWGVQDFCFTTLYTYAIGPKKPLLAVSEELHQNQGR